MGKLGKPDIFEAAFWLLLAFVFFAVDGSWHIVTVRHAGKHTKRSQSRMGSHSIGDMITECKILMMEKIAVYGGSSNAGIAVEPDAIAGTTTTTIKKRRQPPLQLKQQQRVRQ